MANVSFRLDRSLALEIRILNGKMVARYEGSPITFDDKNSFRIDVDTGVVGLRGPDIQRLLNHYVFNDDDAPLTDLSASIQQKYFHLNGTLHNVVDIPFTMALKPAVRNGHIELEPQNMKICSIPGQGLMDAVGVELDEMVELSDYKGISVKDNTLILKPTKLLPPPAVRGSVTGVRIDPGEALVVEFGGTTSRSRSQNNYMLFRGGLLQFGRLSMADSDLRINDSDPSDPFDFYLDQYQRQLGNSKIDPSVDFGLSVEMPDYDDLEVEQ